MKKLIIVLFLIILSSSVIAQATELPKECINELRKQAIQAGISQPVIDAIIPKLKLLPKVIKSDKSQAEFTQTFASYLNKRVTSARIKEGKQLLKKHDTFLNSLVQQYGIPGRYLIAFWGLETNFGHYLGKLSTLNSLATLACDPRRADFFTAELLLALKLIERESLVPEKMKGSWAGAMGHTQFMPSTYYQYAVDGDGDGQINLWLSEKDALASSANYLQQLGWNTGERWGREVKLPADFHYELTGFKNWKSLKEWKNLGLRSISGSLLPEVDIKAAVLLPAGHSGPVFLVYPNFNIIMHWNRSKNYALSVGLLSDQVIGMSPLSKTADKQKPLSTETVFTLQEKLNQAGFNAGQPDGVIGSNTQEAIQAFQLSTGLIADGYPDDVTIKKLQQIN